MKLTAAARPHVPDEARSATRRFTTQQASLTCRAGGMCCAAIRSKSARRSPRHHPPRYQGTSLAYRRAHEGTRRRLSNEYISDFRLQRTTVIPSLQILARHPDRPSNRFKVSPCPWARKAGEPIPSRHRTALSGSVDCHARSLNLMGRGHFARQPLRRPASETYTAQSTV